MSGLQSIQRKPLVDSMRVSVFPMIIAAVCLEVVGQLCFKRGALSVGRTIAGNGVRDYSVAIVRNGWVIGGFGADAVEIVVRLAALCIAPLSVVLPLLSLSYCGVAAGSRLFLGERLVARSIVAILLITLGAILVSAPNVG